MLFRKWGTTITTTDHGNEEDMMQTKTDKDGNEASKRTIALDAKLLDKLSELARVNEKTLEEQIEDILSETARIYENIVGNKD